MIVASDLRLGKKAARYDIRTLRMATFIEKRKLPVVPHTHTLSKKTLKAFPDLGMMRNDNLSCCTIAALGHAEETWSTYGGKPYRPTDEEIVEAYNRVNGGVDEGAVMLDVLKMARKTGIGANKIYAFVGVDPLNHDQVRTAHYLFGGLYIGAMLPISAQDQLDAGLWEVTTGNGSEPNSWGGHAISVVDYSPKTLTVVTWGQLQKMTWDWFDRYVDEAYCVLDADYIGDDKRSPQGFSLTKLAADLNGLGG